MLDLPLIIYWVLLFRCLKCFKRILKWLHCGHAIQIIHLNWRPCLCSPLRLSTLWRPQTLSTGLIVRMTLLTLLLTPNGHSVWNPLHVLSRRIYCLWGKVLQLIFFITLLLYVGIVRLIIICMLLIRILHDFFNGGWKFRVLEGGVVAWGFLKVVQVIELKLDFILLDLLLLLVLLKGQVILSSCSHWRKDAFTWYHILYIKELLLLNYMTVRGTERVKDWVVFDLPDVFKHDLLKLAVKHVITAFSIVNIRFYFAYRVAVRILARFVCLRANGHAASEAGLVRMIGNAIDGGLLLSRAIVLA